MVPKNRFKIIINILYNKKINWQLNTTDFKINGVKMLSASKICMSGSGHRWTGATEYLMKKGNNRNHFAWGLSTAATTRIDNTSK